MTDYLGRELNVGDKVVALAHGNTSSTLYFGEVEKLTNKMVVIKTVDSERDWRYSETMRAYPNKVVKVNVENTSCITTYGQWEEIRDPYGKLEGWIHCDCGREVKCAENYCPNCGAKMSIKG